MKVELQINHYDFRLMIDGLPHVYILREQFVGYQSWSDGENMYVIEFYTKTNSIRTEQDKKEKWVAMLTELNSKL